MLLERVRPSVYRCRKWQIYSERGENGRSTLKLRTWCEQTQCELGDRLCLVRDTVVRWSIHCAFKVTVHTLTVSSILFSKSKKVTCLLSVRKVLYLKALVKCSASDIFGLKQRKNNRKNKYAFFVIKSWRDMEIL